MIKKLGGDVSMCASFDNSATHLLCIRPSRNEKMLSSIAAGKWVLHCSYLRESERAGEFLNVGISVLESISLIIILITNKNFAGRGVRVGESKE